jgi:hypothetical protein
MLSPEIQLAPHFQPARKQLKTVSGKAAANGETKPMLLIRVESFTEASRPLQADSECVR